MSLPALEVPNFEARVTHVLKNNKQRSPSWTKTVDWWKAALAQTTLRVSPKLTSRYSFYRSLYPDGCFQYLIRVAMDEEANLLSNGGLLKWSIDMSTVVAATQALYLCDAEGEDLEFSKINRQRANSILAMAVRLWSTNQLPNIFANVRTHRNLDIAPTIENMMGGVRAEFLQLQAGVVLQKLLKELGVDSNWLLEAWDVGREAFPSDTFPTLGLNNSKHSEKLIEPLVATMNLAIKKLRHQNINISALQKEFHIFADFSMKLYKRYCDSPDQIAEIETEMQAALENSFPTMMQTSLSILDEIAKQDEQNIPSRDRS